MSITIEEKTFIENLAHFCEMEFLKHKNLHRSSSIPLCKVFASPNVTVDRIIHVIGFSFDSVLYSTNHVFKKMILEVTSKISFEKNKNLFITKRFFDGEFQKQSIVYTNALEALKATFTDYFTYIFNNSWTITNYKGFSIGTKYDEYRKHVALEDEFPEIKDTFGKKN